jgi:hypothetical protein
LEKATRIPAPGGLAARIRPAGGPDLAGRLANPLGGPARQQARLLTREKFEKMAIAADLTSKPRARTSKRHFFVDFPGQNAKSRHY